MRVDLNYLFQPFKKMVPLLIALMVSSAATGQEFLFTVTVNTPQLQNVDASVFKGLESQLLELLNNRRWTNDQFEDHEKIKCNLGLTIRDEVSATAFTADMDIQSSRPVYGTNYETTLLNHRDRDVSFVFDDSRPLIFSEQNYTDNLTAIIAFYIYYILGLDYDSFSLYGGDEYFQQAQDIINTLPADVSRSPGWTPNANGQNRYFMMENILNPRSRPFRKAIYNYHREGMDIMASDSDKAKETMVTSLKSIEEVYNDSPNSMIIQMFANAKAEELTEVFTIAVREQKNEVYRLMTRIDPANRNKYIAIRR